tara:strand:+ start:1578 stop:2087 length:510 start_codon:yes stop_codon:yes gene_type:complete
MDYKEINKTRIFADSVENAYVVENYPFGFRGKTQRRSWVETNGKKGDRVVHQTFNLKKGIWNKPKKSTYSSAVVLFINEKGYVEQEGVDSYDGDKVKDFIEAFDLSPEQSKNLNSCLAINKVLSKVKFSCVSSPKSEKEKKEFDDKQNKIKSFIVKQINIETNKLNKGS